MRATMNNPNCDGSGPCDPGRVRVLPLGSCPHHGNLILCRCRFALPAWTSLEIYGEGVAS